MELRSHSQASTSKRATDESEEGASKRIRQSRGGESDDDELYNVENEDDEDYAFEEDDDIDENEIEQLFPEEMEEENEQKVTSLPLTFFLDYFNRDNYPSYYFFVGFFIGDGCNLHSSRSLGIALGSYDFHFLLQLVISVGITHPRYSNSERFIFMNVVRVGIIYASIGGRVIYDSYRDLGFPSSHNNIPIVTVDSLYTRFCRSNRTNFLDLVWGYIAADGTVAISPLRGNGTVTVRSLNIYSTSQSILQSIRQVFLNLTNGDSESNISVYQRSPQQEGYKYMYILAMRSLYKVILKNHLTSMRQRNMPFDYKMELVEKIRDNHAHLYYQRLRLVHDSFNVNDIQHFPELPALARDAYKFTFLYHNDLLKLISRPEINETKEMDFTDYVRRVRHLSEHEISGNIYLRALVGYLDNCRARYISDNDIEDVPCYSKWDGHKEIKRRDHEYYQRTITPAIMKRKPEERRGYCEICKSDFSDINAHIKNVHQTNLSIGDANFKCWWPICTYTALTRRRIITHYLNVHGAKDPLTCMQCHQVFPGKKSLEDHAKLGQCNKE
ncbi:unnamed protein product [Cunninghamella blakesleeana]